MSCLPCIQWRKIYQVYQLLLITTLSSPVDISLLTYCLHVFFKGPIEIELATVTAVDK